MPAYYGYKLAKFCIDSVPLTAQDYLQILFGAQGYCAYEIYQAYKQGDLEFSPTVLFSDVAKKLKQMIKPKISTPLFKLNEVNILQAITSEELTTITASNIHLS